MSVKYPACTQQGARQGVLFADMCSLRVYFFPNLSCLCSLRYAFQPHSKLCVPAGYTISRFVIVLYILSGLGSGSPGGTTPSILVPIFLIFSYLFNGKSCEKKPGSLGDVIFVKSMALPTLHNLFNLSIFSIFRGFSYHFVRN